MLNAKLLLKTMVKRVKITKTLKGRLNFNRIIEGSIPIVSVMLYTKSIDPSVKNLRSLTDSIDHRWKKFDFLLIVLIHWLKIFFLLTTIDLIDVFFRQSIIDIDPIDVFLTIGAHLCTQLSISLHLSLLFSVSQFVWSFLTQPHKITILCPSKINI